MKGTDIVKRGFAQMVQNGVVMDVTNAEQARIAEEAGACAVMALERVPADIRAKGGVARMADPQKIKEIQETVTIPVMAKARIGHFAEAQILQALKVDMIDESEVLTPADEEFHIEKKKFTVPFVCGCRNLGEALRRIDEGASMIRTKGEAGTGNIVEAVRHLRMVNSELKLLKESQGNKKFLEAKAKEYRVPLDLVAKTAKLGRLPVVMFCAGGIATPADASLVLQLGCDGIFVGSGIFKSSDPKKMAKAIVEAAKDFEKAEKLAELSFGLGEAMPGLEISKLEQKLQER